MSIESSDPEEIERQFSRDGYIVIPEALSLERVAELRDQVEQAFDRGPIGFMDDVSIYDVFVAHPEWFDVICNDRIVFNLKALLGDDYVLATDSSVNRGRSNAASGYDALGYARQDRSAHAAAPCASWLGEQE